MITAELSEYEKQRLENIRQNEEVLRSLNLIDIASTATNTRVVNKGRSTKRSTAASKRPSSDRSDENSNGNSNGNGTKKPAKRTVQPTRRSKRLRGESAGLELITPAELHAVETGDVSELLMTGDQRFAEEQLAQAIRVTGHYSGWVEPGVMERLGIRGNATEAWESEGGGRFSFADPLGTGKKVSKKAAGGQSVARYVASKLLRKNPNSYFYRHTEPGVEQWTGDWTAEETQEFLRVAREFGCGDKWGLFSTYIPHRVGYQCSNYYRQYVIPAGWIIDDNYRIDGDGSAVYVGSHRRGNR
ncbi:hypothetical protein GGI07_002626 [Coemansia sp. Benny D115]|nr:hypothetical protein GGI07_002626 [Coemansia sp. Benny D115]